MDKKSKNTLIVSIIALALVLIGVTYAYFSARITGLESASTISLTAGRMGIVFSEGSEDFEASNIYPREEAWITKTFTLTGYNTTDQEMNYYAGFMVINNTFPNAYLTYDLRVLEATSGTPIVEKTGVQINGTGYIRFGKGTFRGANGDHHSYEVKIYFKDNGKDQNDAQEAIFNGKLYVTPGVPQNEYMITENIETKVLKSYAINTEGCTEYLTNSGYFLSSQVSVYCSGGEAKLGSSIDSIVQLGMGSFLEDEGVIENVVRDQNNNITSYTINKSNCLASATSEYSPEDAETLCNGGEVFYYTDMDILVKNNGNYLEEQNVIGNVAKDENNTITSYTINNSNCISFMQNEYGYSLTDSQTICSGGKVNQTVSIASDIEDGNGEYLSENGIIDAEFESTVIKQPIDIYNAYQFEGGQYTYTFNSNLNGWSVTLTDKESTDHVTTKLYTSINGYPIVDMHSMFSNSKAISIDLSSFDTSKVTNMSDMFNKSEATSLDLSNFDTSSVTNMYQMFSNNKANNLDLSSFDTPKVTNMENMFSSSSALSINLNSFDVSNVTNMSGMFSDSQATSLDVSNFRASKATDMSSMFSGAAATTINLKNFDTSSVTNMGSMFYGVNLVELDLSSFDTSNVTSIFRMFNNSQLTSVDLSGKDFSSLTSATNVFNNSSVEHVSFRNSNFSNLSSINHMFNESSKLKIIDFSGADLSAKVYMSYTFSSIVADDEYRGNYGLSSIEKVDFSNANLSSLLTMGGAFFGSKVKNVTFANAKMPLVNNLNEMFLSSYIEMVDFTNVSFTSNYTMSQMFNRALSTSLDIVGLNTSNATSMENLFSWSKIKKLDLSNFNTSNVTNMATMFYKSEVEVIDLGSFDTSNVTNMYAMFSDCPYLKTIYASNSFNTSSVGTGQFESGNNMFSNTPLLVGGKGTLSKVNGNGKMYARIDNPPDSPGYFTAK